MYATGLISIYGNGQRSANASGRAERGKR
jgi:hypothetical protein